ncbi:uncharacterized protein LOC124202699 [Daphnia pulex]|uniref:uncharacterized protein LOC124202699 n=1 Tax=Daphnia pulex TaxID=6669 RepID=UPI001EDCB1FC|nr:uncharacterized protein LOC124202699 [Daphnia pulex]
MFQYVRLILKWKPLQNKWDIISGLHFCIWRKFLQAAFLLVGIGLQPQTAIRNSISFTKDFAFRLNESHPLKFKEKDMANTTNTVNKVLCLLTCWLLPLQSPLLYPWNGPTLILRLILRLYSMDGIHWWKLTRDQ